MSKVIIYGAIIANAKLYEDENIADLVLDGGLEPNFGHYYDSRSYLYSHVKYKKVGWSYAGDQSFKESNILIVVDDRDHVFAGRSGLREAVAFLTALTLYGKCDLMVPAPVAVV